MNGPPLAGKRAPGPSAISEGRDLLAGRIRLIAVAVLSLAACAAIAVLLRRLSHGLDYHGMVHAVRHLPASAVAGSIAATVVSYAMLLARDATLLPLVNARVAPVPLVLGAGCGSALGNAIGVGMLTGGAVRYRVYGAEGVRPEQVASLMALVTLSFGVGLVVTFALLCAVAAGPVAGLLHLPQSAVEAGGLVGLGLAAALVAFARPGRPGLRLGPWHLERPTRSQILVQYVLVALDLAGAGIALWMLLPAGSVGPLEFLALFIGATALGVVSHVPGGLGVFEGVVLLAMRSGGQTDRIAAALLAYRFIYFLLPLVLAGIVLAGLELRWVKERVARHHAEGLRRAVDQIVPIFLGTITFVIGSILIISGATPAFGPRLAILKVTLPLWLVESSHFLGSLIGVLLLFVARGLFLRLDGAWWVALGLCAVSLALSLAKGLAFGEALLLLCLILMLWGARERFDRPASLLGQTFTGTWLLAVAAVMLVGVGMILFAFRDVAYTQDLWWQFEFDAKAPRALRATFAAVVLVGCIAAWQLLRPARAAAAPPSKQDLADAEAIIGAQDRGSALLAMMGDKSFLFSASRTAFVMYTRRGRSWTALYDPVGPRQEWPDLVWRFAELAEAEGGRVAFYQVRPDSLPLYLDAGLKLIKLGEEALLPLADFSLDGPGRSNLRYALKRGERDALSFEVVPPDEVAGLMPVLDTISAAWLAARHAREKGFSVAALVPAYVLAQSVALVRQNGRPVAFVTVMGTRPGMEATIGLMRHVPDTSPYAMEYLFTRLAIHLRDEGVRVLSLGMAPLAGLEPRPLASWWHRLAGLVSRHGGRLYNFQGLRAFKNKFHPVWEPRYMAASGTVGPYLALADVAVLVGIGAR